jgi:DNA-binding NarL/FixJ family response regulator
MNAPTFTTCSSADSSSEDTLSKVLLVDRSQTICHDLAALVNEQPGFAVCALAHEARGGLAAFRQLHPQLVVTGITLPGMDGIKMTEMMVAEEPSARVLIHTVKDDVPYGLMALRAGAKGYVRKGVRPAILINALRHVAGQGLYLPPRLKARLLTHAAGADDRQARSPLQWLGDRDQKIFEALGRGMNVAEIAGLMNLTASAIEAAKARIKDKLGLADARSLLTYAAKWTSRPCASVRIDRPEDTHWRHR